MRSLFFSLTRTSAFLRKEMVEVLRQPRLILSLVLGPFAILLLFGLGFKNEARAIPTLFVVDPQSQFASQIQELASASIPQIIFSGTSQDEQDARQRLGRGEIGLVVVAPQDPAQAFKENRQAEFMLYHNEIDPSQIGYIQSIGQALIDELNRGVLASIAASGQQEGSEIQVEIKSARENAAAMRQALQAGEAVSARQRLSALRGDIASLAVAAGTSAGVLNSVEQNMGGSEQSQSGDILALLTTLQDENNQGELSDDQSTFPAEIQKLEKTEADLARLDELLTEFQSISPEILVQPFRANILAQSGHIFAPADFYTPAVIALLLQHIAITIASLSIVRERRSGAIELFRVSPITSGETLIGKYISYFIFGAIIAAVLASLLYFGLKTPMNGSWWNFAAVSALVLFASLGAGFLISLLAETESQAVQLAMIVLLLSVFFSGFFLDLRYLWGPVQAVSWMLPATYGIIMLQNIMLRGGGISLMHAGILLGMAVLLMLFAWLLLRRRMRHE